MYSNHNKESKFRLYCKYPFWDPEPKKLWFTKCLSKCLYVCLFRDSKAWIHSDKYLMDKEE